MLHPDEPKPFHGRNLLLNLLLILPASLLYAVKTDTPVYPLITLAILLFAFFRKEYLPLRDRPVIYSITAALILTMLPDLLITIDDSRNGIFDLLVRSNLIIPLMLYLAAFSCAFYPYPVRRGITTACVITALVLCGDRFNYERLSNQLLFFLDPLLRHYPWFYGISATLNILTIPLFFLIPGRVESPDPCALSRRLRIPLLAGALILLPLGAAAAAKYYYGNNSLMRAVEYYIFRISMRKYFFPSRSARYRLSTSANLNHPLPPDWNRENTVLFRVRAKNPPGYLRTGVYDFYAEGQWRRRWKRTPSAVPLPVDRHTGIVSYSSFTLAAGQQAAERIELYFAALRTDGRIPVAGNTVGIDAVADSGEITPEGLVRLKQWHADGGCTLLTSGPEQDSAWQGPAGPEKDPALLAVPPELRVPLRKIRTGLIKPGQPVGDADWIAALKREFRRGEYSLTNENAGKGMDPLLYFLTRSRAGHCEFYASAAVLLLRSAGIPARYVTGFLCEEKSPVADYFPVRTQHAHAWCEAYLRDRKTWVVVDLTPDRMREMLFRPSGSKPQAWLDALKQWFQQGFADIRRGHFAQGIINLLSGLGKLLYRFLRTIPGALTALIAAGLLIRRYLRKRKQRQAPHRGLSAARKQLSQEFVRFEKQYAARTGFRRPDHLPLREFYTAPDAAELCRFYEQLRYGPEEPAADRLREFSRRAAELLRTQKQ